MSPHSEQDPQKVLFTVFIYFHLFIFHPPLIHPILDSPEYPPSPYKIPVSDQSRVSIAPYRKTLVVPILMEICYIFTSQRGWGVGSSQGGMEGVGEDSSAHLPMFCFEVAFTACSLYSKLSLDLSALLFYANDLVRLHKMIQIALFYIILAPYCFAWTEYSSLHLS